MHITSDDSAQSESRDFPPAAIAWFSTLLMALLFAMAYLDRQIVSLMVAPISAEFGVGDFEISLLQGFAFAVLFAACGLPFGQAVDRYSRRYIILFGVLVWSIAAMSCGLAQNFGQLLAARVMVGVGEAALAPACYSLLADLFPRKRLTFALAVFMVGALLGAEASLALGGTILSYAHNGVDLPILGMTSAWRFAFIITGLPGIIIAFAALLIHEPKRIRSEQSAAGGWRDVFAFIASRKLFFAVQLIGFSLVMSLSYARLAWGPAYFMRTFGWSVAHTSYALATYGFFVGICSLLLGGRLVDYLAQRGRKDAHFLYYTIGGVLLALFGGLGYLAKDPTIYFLAMIVPSFPLAMGAIGASAIQLVTPAELRGRVSAVYLLVISLIGMSMGPAVVGLMTDKLFGDPQSIGVALAITFAVVGCVTAVLFRIGMPAMRDAVATAEAREAAAGAKAG